MSHCCSEHPCCLFALCSHVHPGCDKFHSPYLSQWIRKSLSLLSTSHGFEGDMSVECYGWPSTLVKLQPTLLYCASHTTWLPRSTSCSLCLSAWERELAYLSNSCTLPSSFILAEEVDQGNAWRILPVAGTHLTHYHHHHHLWRGWSDRWIVPARNGKWTLQIN